MLNEVREVLDVEGGQRGVADQAASGDPAVVGRAGSAAELGVGLKLAPPDSQSVVVGEDDEAARKVRIVARLRLPQRRTRVHFVSSPTVTKEMAGLWPTSWRERLSGVRWRSRVDATSVSRTMRLTRGRLAVMRSGRR